MRFNRVFLISLAFTAAIGAWGLIDPDAMTSTATGVTNYLLRGASWYWLLLTTGFVILAAFMALGPYGKIRLGKDQEKPEFSTPSWIAMLFAGGMGAGLLFWGVADLGRGRADVSLHGTANHGRGYTGGGA